MKKNLLLSTATIVSTLCYTCSVQACDEGYIKGYATQECIPASGNCGSGCTYTLDSDGNLNIMGNGSIGTQKFQRNQDIVNVTIGDGIKTIGVMAFEYMTNLRSVEIPNSVTNIKSEAFNGNPNLEKLVIPSSVTKIGAWGATGIGTVVLDSAGVDNLIINIGSIDEAGVGHSFSVYNNSTQKLICNECTVEQMNRLKEKLAETVVNGANEVLNTSNIFIHQQNGDFTLVKDIDGNLLSIRDLEWNSVELDDKGNVIKKYSDTGQFLGAWSYGDDGSINTYNENGKLIGIQGKRILTVDEATALAKGNKNTFSIRYR